MGSSHFGSRLGMFFSKAPLIFPPFFCFILSVSGSLVVGKDEGCIVEDIVKEKHILEQRVNTNCLECQDFTKQCVGCNVDRKYFTQSEIQDCMDPKIKEIEVLRLNFQWKKVCTDGGEKKWQELFKAQCFGLIRNCQDKRTPIGVSTKQCVGCNFGGKYFTSSDINNCMLPKIKNENFHWTKVCLDGGENYWRKVFKERCSDLIQTAVPATNPNQETSPKSDEKSGTQT